VAARKQKQKRLSAQVVEDEDYQLRYEVAAGIDVAKESAVVCVRMPPAAGRKHRTSHLQTVPATVPAIGELAAELKAAGVQMVSMEATGLLARLVCGAGGGRAGSAAGELFPGQEPAGQAEDRQGGRAAGSRG
jgi:hypothetical protein